MPLLNGVWLLDPEGTPHQVPDNEGVIGYFKGRGYQVTDLPSHLDSDDEEFQAKLAELQQVEEEQPQPEPEVFEVSTEAESATTKKGK